ncbi:serine protease [Conexibacter sp. W3-3-2]|uniref:serine protease n=1 Tax=Conexibacter sp. W3-3-2 TaxID=2675227 RepID=UPI0012B86207|nr:serine protease [Conexibacter sp. W3-3-2]
MTRLSTFLAAATVCAGIAAAPAAAAPAWAPAASATVTPGVQTFTAGSQCTANFVFTDASGGVYLGQAAHCAGTGEATDTNGCEAKSLPLGTAVTVRGASRPGTLVYSSWLTMQGRGERDDDTCQYNDFALVKLDRADHGRVNPSIPHWGGPTAPSSSGTRLLDTVYSYGNSSLRGGLKLLSPKRGVSLGANGGGWNHPVYTLTPGIPGDSGSAFLDRSGRALGVLSTLSIAPVPLSNGVSDVARAVRYANANGGVAVTLATGTERFRANALPLGVRLGLLDL